MHTLNYPRDSDDHGGIAVIYKTAMKLRTLKLDIATLTFEHACITEITYVVIYRPPPSQNNKLKASDFLEEFDNFAIYINLCWQITYAWWL